MYLYKYDKKTKEYLGYFEAYLDQLETIKAGKDVYVIPPYSTDVIPTQPQEGNTLLFKGDNWEEVEDNRGLKVYDKNGEVFVITEFGPIPKGFSKEKPVTLKDLKDEKVKEINGNFEKAWNTRIQVANMDAIIEESYKYTSLLKQFEGFNKICFKDGDIAKIVRREDVEELIKRLYLRSILLTKKKTEKLKEVFNCKSKKKLQEIESTFDVSQEVEELITLTQEEIDKKFKKY